MPAPSDEPPEDTSPGFRGRTYRWLTAEAVVIPLAAAVLGLFGGLAGAYLGARATVTTQREQADADRREEARKQKVNTYTAFLDAARNYRTKADALEAKCLRRTKSGKLARCVPPTTNRYFTARDVQGALNDVYVYGSAPGVLRARAIAGALPPSLSRLDGGFSLAPVERERFRTAYVRFLDLMCREVSADPRPNC